MNFDHLANVEDCAIALDGGSICIALAGPSERIVFVIVRSVASLGTSAHGKVHVNSKEGKQLSSSETLALCRRLRAIPLSGDTCHDLVAIFIQQAEQHAEASA